MSLDRLNLELSVERVAWDLYLLSLATRYHCEVPILPDKTLKSIDHIAASDVVSSESQSRISVMRGLFGLFTEVTDVPRLQCFARAKQSFKERIDEILEDAYLLEASHLRRFFGFGANLASIRRDLRKLVRFIAENRRWAKGVLAAGSSTFPLAKSPTEMASKLLDIIPNLQLDGSAPLLVPPDAQTDNLDEIIISYRRRPFMSWEFWMIRSSRQ